MGDAALWVVILGLLGAGMIVGGVYLLAGLGWCLIAGGVSAVFVAAFIKRGLSDG